MSVNVAPSQKKKKKNQTTFTQIHTEIRPGTNHFLYFYYIFILNILFFIQGANASNTLFIITLKAAKFSVAVGKI